MTPPRLHVIPAVACDKALILRRGPSGQVATLLWDRADDSFERGQWLIGRIYEHRADLSPDGRHMVYFAGTGQRWWTAVSRAPWLRALAFFPQNHTWHGGGGFDADGRLWLNGASAGHETLPDGLKPAPDTAFPHDTDGFHMGGMYAALMALRGWEHLAGQRYDTVLGKSIGAGWRLELSFQLSAKNRAIISNRYELVSEVRDLRRACPQWEWAEPYKDVLQFARNGALHTARLDQDGTLHDVETIRDFSDMTFAPIDAPYTGVAEQEGCP